MTPTTAELLRGELVIATDRELLALARITEAYRDLHARTCDDYWADDECACGGRQLLAATRFLKGSA